MLTIVPLDPARREPLLAWDTVWDGFTGDWSASDGSETGNIGGLRARQQLSTAIILLLMTDARAPDSTETPDDSPDRRGWVGDGFDLEAGERALGSQLWTLRRSALTAATARLAADHARTALQPLIDQGAAETITVTTEAQPTLGRIALAVSVTSRASTEALRQDFAILWDRL